MSQEIRKARLREVAQAKVVAIDTRQPIDTERPIKWTVAKRVKEGLGAVRD